MLIALAISLIARMFGGGPEEIFQVPKLEKEIKTHVVDQDNEQQLLDLTKQAKKEIKAFNKSRGKKMKVMKKSNASKDFTKEMMEELYMAYHDERLELQTKLLAKRLKFQELMTEDEWHMVIKKAVFPSDKVQKKTDKVEVKEELEIDKMFSKLQDAIEKNIIDTKGQEKVLTELNIFKRTLDDFVSISQEMNYQDSELVRKKTATAGELKGFYNQQNELRVEGAMAFFSFRTVAIKNTSDKEWEDLVDEMKLLFK
jgi:hypothetical protein